MTIAPSTYYGLPAPPAATAPTSAPAAAGSASTAGAVRTGLHQDPVFLLVGLLFLAFLLARIAEHGLSLGFKVSASAR